MTRKMKSPTTVCYPVKRGLEFVGVWPDIRWSGIHKAIWITVTLLHQVFQYRYIVLYFKTVSLEVIVDILSIAFVFGLTFFKLVIAWTHQDELRYIVSTMKEDCRKYAVIDTNNFIPKIANFSYRLIAMIMALHIMSELFYVVGFICQPTNSTMSRELPLKMELPFDTNNSPIYEIVIIMQFIHQFMIAFTCGMFSVLLLMVILHVGCQVDIMCNALLEYTNERKKQLRFFIRRHQEIILFTEKIENFFRYIALSQLVSNTIITCFLGFLMVVSIGSSDGLPVFIKCILFYIVVCSEAFIYCFAGEYLNIKSELIGNTAYESLWYDFEPNEIKLLVLLIGRSQKGFTLTFGKFSNLSLECFTSIMKVSASYVSMLLAIN